MKKKNIKVDPPTELLRWYLKQTILYGDAINVWWNKYGMNLFLDWGKKQGLKYVSIKKRGKHEKVTKCKKKDKKCT